MKTPPALQTPKPPVTGLNKKTLAAAALIALVTVAGAIFILTTGEDSQIVKTEPRVARRGEFPPASLLEEPPPPPPPPEVPPLLLLEPEPEDDPVYTQRRQPPEPPEDRLHQEALKSTITGRSQNPPSHPPGATADFLDRALSDLERQGERLARLQGTLSGLDPLAPVSQTPAAGTSSPSASTVRFIQEAPAYRVSQGTLLDAQLLTAIDSHLPGQITAQITHDVTDSGSFHEVLIPRGSKLLGRYEENLALGQNRILVEWTRILYPNGASLEMPAQPGVDSQGRAGLKDRVNHHVARVFGHAFLLSLIGAGFELSQPAEATDRSRLAITGASRELELAAAEILRSRTNLAPTIKIRPGTRFQVLLNRDLVFAEPYRG